MRVLCLKTRRLNSKELGARETGRCLGEDRRVQGHKEQGHKEQMGQEYGRGHGSARSGTSSAGSVSACRGTAQRDGWSVRKWGFLSMLIWQITLILFFKKFKFIYFYREGKRERNFNVWLPLTCHQLGTWPKTQACALIGN